MAAPEAPLLDAAGKASKQVSLESAVFGNEVKPHLIHETVRAELNAARAGTRGAKSRGMVAGGRAKPWRQKGTGRARQGTIRAPHFTGGGVAFAPQMRSFEVKVNRKARRAALSSALSAHAAGGTLGLIDGAAFEAPSTKQAVALTAAWGKELPLVLVVTEDEQNLIDVLPQPAACAHRHAVRARGRVRGLGPLAAHQRSCSAARRGPRGHEAGRGAMSLLATQILIAPVVSEKSYRLIEERKYSFRVHPDAHRTQVRQAVEQQFGVKVVRVNMLKVKPKPKRRGAIKGVRQGWTKAIVQVREGDVIPIFEGAQV